MVITVSHCCYGNLVAMVTNIDTGITADFKISLDTVREIHSRRYNMQRTAMEIFLTDQTNYFINFSSSKVRPQPLSL